MTFKFKFKVRGGHTHVRVFAGEDRDHVGKCGDLVFRNEEFDAFRTRVESPALGQGYEVLVLFEKEAE